MKEVVFISNCLLNQYMRAEGVTSIYKENGSVCAMANPLLKLLMEMNVAVEQLPCPEVRWEGLKRPAAGLERYDNESYKSICKQIVDEIILLAKEYERNGVVIAGVIGVNASPSCGVEFTSDNIPRRGIFMEMLEKGFISANLRVPFVGFRAKTKDDLENSLEKIKHLINNRRFKKS